MFMKSILAATAVAATLAGAAPMAEAHHKKINLDVGIGIGAPGCYSGYYDPDCEFAPPPPPRPRRHVYVPDNSWDDGYDNYDEDYDRLSCGQGRQIVRQSGWRNVRAVDCDGQNYKYTGFRRGARWVVMLDSRTGQIIRRNRY